MMILNEFKINEKVMNNKWEITDDTKWIMNIE